MLEVNGFTFKKTELEGGWGIVVYTHEIVYPGSHKWWYLYHCGARRIGIDTRGQGWCSNCGAPVPEHLKGFLDLCSYT